MRWLPTRPLKIKGAEFNVPFGLNVNESFFIPSLKHKETYHRVADYYSPHLYKLVWAERIESGVLGIRVWRVA